MLQRRGWPPIIPKRWQTGHNGGARGIAGVSHPDDLGSRLDDFGRLGAPATTRVA